LLITVGMICLVAGILILNSDRIPFLGKLPGDIIIERENFKLFFPITTSILISVVLSLIVYLINRFR
jgi:uncharacterized protein HemY